jgi:hypothetical protein
MEWSALQLSADACTVQRQTNESHHSILATFCTREGYVRVYGSGTGQVKNKQASVMLVWGALLNQSPFLALPSWIFHLKVWDYQ